MLPASAFGHRCSCFSPWHRLRMHRIVDGHERRARPQGRELRGAESIFKRSRGGSEFWLLSLHAPPSGRTFDICVKRFLQSGHVFSVFAHFCMHSKQNKCEHELILPRTVGVSMQMTHSSSSRPSSGAAGTETMGPVTFAVLALFFDMARWRTKRNARSEGSDEKTPRLLSHAFVRRTTFESFYLF